MAGTGYHMDGLGEWKWELARAIEEQYLEGSKAIVIQVAVELQGKIEEKTPKKTGWLQNNWETGEARKHKDEYVVEVYNNVEYAEAAEWGHWQEVGQYILVPGKRLKAKTTKGAHMMKLSLAGLRAVLPGYLQEWMSDFLNTHDIVQDRRNYMDKNILQAIKGTAISMLRGHEPDMSVYAEEIMRTDRTLEPENEDNSK